MQFGNGVRAEHLIFIAPEWYKGAGAKFNAKEYVNSLVDSNVDCVEFYVKDHHGISYYNTEAGVRSSYMEGDFLGDLCNEAASKGIDVIAYFSICWDNYMAERHPSWWMRNTDGGPIKANYWTYLCFNSPFKDYMLQQIKEIAEYDVKGFWLDILRFPELFRNGCFCDYCKKKFKEITHLDPPAGHNPEDPTSRAYLKFLQNSVTSFLRDIKEAVGDKEITSNGVGFITPVEWNDLCSWHNVESHGPEFIDQSFKGRYLAGLRKPWEILTPTNFIDWSSWSAKPADTMKLEFAITSSQGGTVTYGTSSSIEGSTIAPRTNPLAQRAAIKESYGWIKEVDEWTKGGKRIADIAILYSLATHESMFGGHPNPGMDQDLFRAYNVGQPVDAFPREVALETRGFHLALYNRGFQYEVLNEYSTDRIMDFDTIILPDQRYLPDETIDAIRNFVAEGGNLIATYKTSLFDPERKTLGNFALSDLLGTDLLDVSEYTTNYVEPLEADLENGLYDFVLPFHQGSTIVSARPTTDVIGNLRFPDTERVETRFFFHEHSGPDPRGVRVFPAITRNRVGKGQVFYVSAPLAKGYYLSEDPSIGELLRNLVSIASKGIVQTSAGGGLEINLTRNPTGDQVIVHLVNHYSTRVESFVPCRAVKGIDIKIDEGFLRKYLRAGISKVYEAPSKREIKFEEQDGKISFSVDELEIYKVIVLE